MNVLLRLNPENASDEEVALYRTRTAARAVVTDSEGNIALLKVGKHGYYKLPGGGVDPGEDIPTALARECREEIGCTVDVYGEVGAIEEDRKMFQLRQTSHCFLARVVGEKGAPDFTDRELANAFSIVWVPRQDVLALFNTAVPDNQEGRDYIVPRDRRLLEAALALHKA